MPGLESPGELTPDRFFYKWENIMNYEDYEIDDYYPAQEKKYLEELEVGVIAAVVLLIIAVVLGVAQAIHGWLQ